MNADAAILRSELDADPANVGYSAYWPLAGYDPDTGKVYPGRPNNDSDVVARLAAEDSLCALLNAANRSVSRTRTVLKLSEMLGLVRPQVLGALMSLPVTPTFISDVSRGDKTAVGIWITAFAGAAVLNETEAAALLAYVAGNETVTVSRAAELGLPDVGRGLLRVAERGGI